uniref:HAUS augmin-like complex subunit 8 isoform X2 n=1 Tax=Ciona intestinalis TaxID=7719 RepID=UPI000180C45D|nr:HAUS augmin-like complex subunit 8 isoform X2 [Ciona intestinalis]|eukprot:XP_002130132.1 HAUS augmin-like complex subunit 8 isoform X2 [Ciona intestinalis]
MDKKSMYRPVKSSASKHEVKGLAQGKPSQRTSNLKITNSLSEAHGDVNSNEIQPGDAKKSTKVKVICHAPGVVHSNIVKKAGKPHTVAVDVPPTIYITSEDVENSISVQQAGQSVDGCQSQGATATLQDTDPKKVIHRKKRGKVIQSRYMQSASLRKNVKSLKSDSAAPMADEKSSNSVTKHGSLPTAVQTPPKQKIKREKELNAKSSTPTAGFKSFFESDVSTIQTAQTTQTNEKVIKPRQPKPATSNEEITQLDLDLRFGEYLRAVYLHETLKTSADNRQKKAMNDLRKLTAVNISLEEELTELQMELATLERDSKLNEMIETQCSVLGPVVNQLTATTERYNCLAENIDSTRHGLQLSGAMLPDEKSLCEVLEKTNEAAAETIALLRTHVEPCSEAASSFNELANLILKEQIIANETMLKLKEATAKSNRELNLKYQLSTLDAS